MIVGQETNRFSFPAVTAKITDEQIDEFGRALIADYAEREVVGIKIHGIELTFLLKKAENRNER